MGSNVKYTWVRVFDISATADLLTRDSIAASLVLSVIRSQVTLEALLKNWPIEGISA
jgi:hypothetical protein